MKTGTADMIEGTEAWERFRDAAKKMILARTSGRKHPRASGTEHKC
jgi:hypothetical protein